MSNNKKAVRNQFRNAVFKRDNYACRICGFQSTPEQAQTDLDAHHITNRNLMPNGGYVPENGITLCKAKCHEEAEQGRPSPESLYILIGSSKETAEKAAKALDNIHLM